MDDTINSVQDKDINVILQKLQEDGEKVLQFIASNGLLANPSKTVLIVMGDNTIKDKGVKIDQTEIKHSKVTKLLGMDVDSDQKWKTHYNG